MSLQLFPASFGDIDKLVYVIYTIYTDPYNLFVDLYTLGLGYDSPVKCLRGERETIADYL